MELQLFAVGAEVSQQAARETYEDGERVIIPAQNIPVIRFIGSDARQYACLVGRMFEPSDDPARHLHAAMAAFPIDGVAAPVTRRGRRLVLEDEHGQPHTVKPLGLWSPPRDITGTVRGFVAGWGCTIEQRGKRWFFVPYISMQYPSGDRTLLAHVRMCSPGDQATLVTPDDVLFYRDEDDEEAGAIPQFFAHLQDEHPLGTYMSASAVPGKRGYYQLLEILQEPPLPPEYSHHTDPHVGASRPEVGRPVHRHDEPGTHGRCL